MTMTKEEKMLLLELLLLDIRGNWGWESENRADLALTLARELGLEKHEKRIEEYLGDGVERDGRIFRTDFENGGYEGMGNIHGLQKTYYDKSEEFKTLVGKYLTYPESLLEDMKS